MPYLMRPQSEQPLDASIVQNYEDPEQRIVV